jgi:hypothetical protein
MAARMKSTCEQYQNDRLAAANRILRAQLPKRLLLTDPPMLAGAIWKGLGVGGWRSHNHCPLYDSTM